MQSNNPLFSRDDAFTRNGYATFGTAPAVETPTADQLQGMYDAPAAAGRAMTIDDVVAKMALIFLVGAVGVGVNWAAGFPALLTMGGLLVGFVLSLVLIFKKEIVPALVLVYAFAEGLFLGGISAIYLELYPDGVAGVNIVLAAVAGTVAAFGGMLVVFSSGRLRATPKFVQLMSVAGIAIIGILVVSLVVALFGGGEGIFGNGPLGLVFCAGMVLFGAFSLILDFDAIKQGIEQGVPEKESWRAAFGLALTIVFLYFYILRLLGILSSD
jgi:uncharacterized YccA/Bax inhibitor family protein